VSNTSGHIVEYNPDTITDSMSGHVFIFGCGYTGRTLSTQLCAGGWRVSGTTREQQGLAAIETTGATAYLFNGEEPSPLISQALSDATHAIISIAPNDSGDPVLNNHLVDLEHSKALRWVGYLSTVGVYGNHDGAWVDETTPLKPNSLRSRLRTQAEQSWQSAADTKLHCALEVFRLAGIYGPGRSPFDKLRAGTARRLIKPDQVFNRIHVEDIAGALVAAINRAGKQSSGKTNLNPTSHDAQNIFNITDDLPAPPQDVVAHAAELLGVAAPTEVPFETADITPMARSFYGENKRVSNQRMKQVLGYTLKFPTYAEGLRSLLAD